MKYRELEPEDIIQEGDEARRVEYPDKVVWAKVGIGAPFSYYIGSTYKTYRTYINHPIRRLIPQSIEFIMDEE